MVTIIRGTTTKAMASEELIDYFNKNKSYSGYLYVGYPIIGTVDGAYPIDAIWVSAEKGLVVFNLVEATDIDNYQDLQDDCANKVESKLKGYKQLTTKRNLDVEINVITFAPAIKGQILEYDPDYPLCSENTLTSTLKSINWNNNKNYEALLSVLQAISTIRKGKKKREIKNKESRGAKLYQLEESIANLDNRQSRAVIETVEGVQRIRGLAGSGKTIVLALKAAYLHAQHPEWKIAVTFNTRSLKGQIKKLINTFYIEQTSDEPDWDNVQIIHAWGAPGGGERNGIYYTFCAINNIEYNDYTSAKNKYGLDDSFGQICKKAVDEVTSSKQCYDVILIDEAQDFSPSFLRLCYEMLKSPKRLVYAYDELQNLRLQSLPSPEKIFGNDINGTPRVTFNNVEEGKPQQDIILEKCYRNSRPALVTAHALGFGIYREKQAFNESNLVQMFDQNDLWNDIGYEVCDGELEDGHHVTLERTSKSSPLFLENHSDIDDLIIFKKFDNFVDQNEWVAQEIKNNLTIDELRPDDIIVINPDPLTTKNNVGPIRALLYSEGIKSHTAGVDTTPDVFFIEDNDSIAFSGIYRAKGNEAAMVYIINSQSCFDSYFDLAKIRNQLFTAITRSKAWVRVLGIGPDMDGLIKEYNSVKSHGFKLDFQIPTEEQRKLINIVNRDMSESEKKIVKKNKNNVNNLIQELENGELFLEDLGKDQVEKLRKLLNNEQ